MGSMNTDIEDHRNVEVVIPYKLVTSEIANLYNITIIDAPKMTLEEVKEKIGYPIEIVKE